MTARAGLETLIDVLRTMTDTWIDDYTGGTTVYWDADQLQRVLDRHRRDFRLVELEPIVKMVNGTAQYFEYQAPYGNLEGGTANFWIETGDGTDIGTANYTVDYLTGRVTFTANTEGTAYYMTGRSYDLNAAAADVWRIKAGQAAKVYNISGDGHSLQRGQLIEHYLKMAQYYEALREPITVTVMRGDYPGVEG